MTNCARAELCLPEQLILLNSLRFHLETQEHPDGVFFLGVKIWMEFKASEERGCARPRCCSPLWGNTWEEKQGGGKYNTVIETSCVRRRTDRGQERFSFWIQKSDKKHQQSNEIKSRRMEGRDLYISH